MLGQSDAAFEALRAARKTWPFAISPDYEERFRASSRRSRSIGSTCRNSLPQRTRAFEAPR